MHIVHLTVAHQAGDVRIFCKQCRTLAAAGHQVTLIVPAEAGGRVDGVMIKALALPHKRIQRMTKTAIQLVREASRLEADVYHLHDPELLPWGLYLQRRTGRPVIYDVHEYYAENMSSKAYLPRPLRPTVSALMRRMEISAARTLAGVVVVNEDMRERFAPLNRNTVIVHNFPFRATAEAPPQPLANGHTVIYVGVLRRDRGYECVLETMPLVRYAHPQAKCLILGRILKDGIAPKYVADEADYYRRGGIQVHEWVAHDKVREYLSSSTVGWIPFAHSFNNDHALPNKLFEYMAVGRAVVVSDLPYVARIVRQCHCGIVVPADDPKAHAGAILYLLEHPTEAREMGQRGRQAVLERYNWEREVEALLKLYAQVAKGSGMRSAESGM